MGKIILNWSASPGATGYYLAQATNSAGTFKIIGTNVPNLSFTDNGLTNGIVYYYTVTATNAFGSSDVSTQASAQPVSPAVPFAWIRRH
jgi:fibronectin type 3 domain-containing protein